MKEKEEQKKEKERRERGKDEEEIERRKVSYSSTLSHFLCRSCALVTDTSLLLLLHYF